MNDDRLPDDVDETDVIACRHCGKLIGYWEDDDNIRAFCGFKMCFDECTCLECLEADRDCND